MQKSFHSYYVILSTAKDLVSSRHFGSRNLTTASYPWLGTPPMALKKRHVGWAGLVA